MQLQGLQTPTSSSTVLKSVEQKTLGYSSNCGACWSCLFYNKGELKMDSNEAFTSGLDKTKAQTEQSVETRFDF